MARSLVAQSLYEGVEIPGSGEPVPPGIEEAG